MTPIAPSDTLKKLQSVLNSEQLAQLVRCLHDVKHDTGFGAVVLVIQNGQVALMKMEKSYKPGGEAEYTSST